MELLTTFWFTKSLIIPRNPLSWATKRLQRGDSVYHEWHSRWTESEVTPSTKSGTRGRRSHLSRPVPTEVLFVSTMCRWYDTPADSRACLPLCIQGALYALWKCFRGNKMEPHQEIFSHDTREIQSLETTLLITTASVCPHSESGDGAFLLIRCRWHCHLRDVHSRLFEQLNGLRPLENRQYYHNIPFGFCTHFTSISTSGLDKNVTVIPVWRSKLDGIRQTNIVLWECSTAISSHFCLWRLNTWMLMPLIGIGSRMLTYACREWTTMSANMSGSGMAFRQSEEPRPGAAGS